MTGEHACDNFGVDAFFFLEPVSVLYCFSFHAIPNKTKKDNCPLVEGRNNFLLAQSRVRSEGGQPCLNALGTLFGGLAMFPLPSPLTVGGYVSFFSCRVATDGSFEHVRQLLRNTEDAEL